MNNAPNLLANGFMLDEFEIIRMLGSGGMGQVYLAIDNNLGRLVCIKIIRTKDGGPITDKLHQRFHVEVQAQGRLNNPHIVTIHSFYTSKLAGIPYIVMEYVDGVDMGTMISDQGKLDWKRVLLFAEQIFDALKHSHKLNVIHRDIKPANIIIRKDDAFVKITDFGLAKLAETKTKLTDERCAVGTYPYMSPEQWEDSTHVTDKADIFSTGVLLYEAIVGNVPFDGNQGETYRKIMVGQHECVNKLVHGVDPELVTLIHHMLDVDPRMRPTAEECHKKVSKIIEHINTEEVRSSIIHAATNYDKNPLRRVPIEQRSTQEMDEAAAPNKKEHLFTFSGFVKNNKILSTFVTALALGNTVLFLWLVFGK